MQFELCIATGFTMVAPEGFEPPTFWFVATLELITNIFDNNFKLYLLAKLIIIMIISKFNYYNYFRNENNIKSLPYYCPHFYKAKNTKHTTNRK